MYIKNQIDKVFTNSCRESFVLCENAKQKFVGIWHCVVQNMGRNGAKQFHIHEFASQNFFLRNFWFQA